LLEKQRAPIMPYGAEHPANRARCVRASARRRASGARLRDGAEVGALALQSYRHFALKRMLQQLSA